jgi:phage-related protein
MGITEAGDIIPGGIFDRVTQEAQEFLKWINENRQSIIELGNNFINFGLKVGRAIMSIPAKFQQFLDLLSDLKKRVDEVGLAIATYFKPEIEALTKIFDFFIQNILPYIISSLAILAGVLVWIGANIITALIYAWEQLREPVMQFALALMEVWAGVSPVIAVILGLVAVLIAVLVPVLQIVWSYVVQVFSGILQVITGVINLVIGIIKAGIGLIYGIFTGDFRMAGEGFKQIWMGLIQFVSGIWTMMKAHVVAIIDGIKSTFKSIDLIQAGKDAIQGFINGIGNMAGALKEKVEGLANTVKNGIKDALKIKSPSRVMMDVGMDTGAGLELGLENSKGNIETQVNSISDLIISGFDGTNTNTQTQTTNMTNNFNVSGAQNPQTIINELMRQLARMNNLANSGVGQAI